MHCLVFTFRSARYAFEVKIDDHLGTSSVRHAPVLTLFESCQRMVDQVADRADTWMERSSEDIEASDGQGYDYGLRMLSAFARVVGKCSQAHDDTTSERVDAQEKQADSLKQWNRIALHRCRCDACLHLKRINQHHLASLPLWLCEEFETAKAAAEAKAAAAAPPPSSPHLHPIACRMSFKSAKMN